MTPNSDSQGRVRVMIADDHGVLRAGLRILLEQDRRFEVVAEAGEGEEALRQALAVCPDLMLLDISMPGLDGLQIARQLKAAQPRTLILILTAHEDVELLREAIRSGASGYVVKRAVDSELTNAIAAVLRGEVYVHPAVTRALLENRPLPVNPGLDDGFDQLTPREVEVLTLLVSGYTNQQIADSLTLSIRTVETHRTNLTHKLGTHNRVDLVQIANRHGLVKR